MTRPRQSKPALELIEEAIHLLRTAAPATLAVYCAGTLPFVLALLYFWTDMSRSADAQQRLAGASLGLAALFLWMKLCHSLFSLRLNTMIAMVPSRPLKPRLCARIMISQAALQPTGLFLLPLAAIPILPLGWVYAFYQNLTVLASSEQSRAREQAASNHSHNLWSLIKEARRQAALWPSQNNAVLGVMTLFGFCIFLNWVSVCLLLPGAFKTLFGFETVFSRSSFSMLNSTFFAVTLALTWLCVDPLIKAIYVLRCFYGQSLESGEDLKAELRTEEVQSRNESKVQSPRSKVQNPESVVSKERLDIGSRHSVVSGLWSVVGGRWTLVFGFLLMLHTPWLFAATPPPGNVSADGAATRKAEPSTTLSPINLEHSIQKVIEQRKYTWRAPREKAATTRASDKSWLGKFFEQVTQWLGDCAKAFGDWLGRLLEKLFPGRRSATVSAGFGDQWTLMLRILLVVLAAGAAGALLLLIFRTWKNRRSTANASAISSPELAPDVADENVGAEQLPEDGWLRMARELLGRGELRLALRAFYFASLARLAERNLITLARFKSNRDYEHELRRRGHSLPNLRTAFAENVTVFERIWYGMHEVNAEMVKQFSENAEQTILIKDASL